MKKYIFCFLMSLFFVVVGCSNDDNAVQPEISISGTWSGSDGTMLIEITISESIGTVTGYGTVSIPGVSTVSCDVQGSFIDPEITLKIEPEGFHAITFTGEMGNDELMTGRISGSGFENATFNFNKK